MVGLQQIYGAVAPGYGSHQKPKGLRPRCVGRRDRGARRNDLSGRICTDAMGVVQALEEVRLRYGLTALRECVRPLIDGRCHIPVTHIPGFRTYLRLNAVDRTNPICVG